jgi:hypothetical protein
MNVPRCLVLIPHGRFQDPIRHIIVDVLKRAGVFAILPGEAVAGAGAQWADERLESLHSSDFIIADLSESNPNIIFQLGVAHGLRKPLIILVSTKVEAKIPSDLLGYQYITYDPFDPSDLEDRLGRFVHGIQKRLERLEASR